MHSYVAVMMSNFETARVHQFLRSGFVGLVFQFWPFQMFDALLLFWCSTVTWFFTFLSLVPRNLLTSPNDHAYGSLRLDKLTHLVKSNMEF